MSSLNSAPQQTTSSFGSPREFKLSWEIFVKYVVDVTVEAYQEMRAKAEVWKHYDEETLSAILAEKYIERVANNRLLQLLVHVEVPIRRPDMMEGSSPTPIRKARKIDIQMYGSWEKEYRKRYFAWECKKICDRATNSNLITEYVSEGIFRFCDGEYSSEVDNAGMIGYVIEGEIPDIVQGINESMTSPRRARQLPHEEKLTLGDSVRNMEDVYVSSHIRNPNKPHIRLHHLFMTFIWMPEPNESSQTQS